MRNVNQDELILKQQEAIQKDIASSTSLVYDVLPLHQLETEFRADEVFRAKILKLHGGKLFLPRRGFPAIRAAARFRGAAGAGAGQGVAEQGADGSGSPSSPSRISTTTSWRVWASWAGRTRWPKPSLTPCSTTRASATTWWCSSGMSSLAFHFYFNTSV